jgi:hypothetical protein
MKSMLVLALTAVLAGSLSAAEGDGKAAVASAIKKLAEKPNYAWTSTPSGNPNWRMGPTEGKAEKGGYTCCKFTWGENDVEMAFKGDKAALHREGEWQSAEDLEGGDTAWIARRLKAFKAPAAEAEDLLAKVKALKQEDDGAYAGDLTEEGLKEWFARMRRGNSTATNLKGWVKFWLKEGVLTKYEFNTQARITVGEDQREMEVDRTTKVEIKDVGTTKVTVPEEAKKKLS